MFREGVYIILKFSTAVFIYSFPPKYSLCWLQSDCCFCRLLRRYSLSSVLQETFLWEQRSDSMDSRSFAFLTSPIWVTLVPMYLLETTLAPFSCPARCKPSACGLMSSCCHVYAYPSCWCLFLSASRAPKLCLSSLIFGAGNFTEWNLSLQTRKKLPTKSMDFCQYKTNLRGKNLLPSSSCLHLFP